MQAFGKVPYPHQPAADFRMIGLQPLSFDFGERRMIALRRVAAIEVGYGLVEQYRGRGLGTEALAALIAYCRTRPEVRTILADTEVQNKVSQRVLEKCGFTFIRANDEACFYRLAL